MAETGSRTGYQYDDSDHSEASSEVTQNVFAIVLLMFCSIKDYQC